MTKCESFKPQINKSSNVLILGSMPGVKSLEEQEYYAHPQNRFWKVMSKLCNKDITKAEYNIKIQTLLENNIAKFAHNFPKPVLRVCVIFLFFK